MSTNNNAKSETSSSATDEFKESNSKFTLSKFDHDLYHDADNVSEKVIRIKRFSMPNKGEKWKIFENDKVVYVLEGSKLTGKEREFLGTVAGITFLIAQHKIGIKTISALKSDIKKNMATS